jgi:hypothetical protein
MKPSLYVSCAIASGVASVVAPWLAAVAVAFLGLEALSPKFQRERTELKKLKADLLKARAAMDKEVVEELGRIKNQVALLTGGRRQ